MKNLFPVILVFWLHFVKLNSTRKSVKTNSNRFNPLLGSEGQTQPVSTQKSGQFVGLNPKKGWVFNPQFEYFHRTSFSTLFLSKSLELICSIWCWCLQSTPVIFQYLSTQEVEYIITTYTSYAIGNSNEGHAICHDLT